MNSGIKIETLIKIKGVYFLYSAFFSTHPAADLIYPENSVLVGNDIKIQLILTNVSIHTKSNYFKDDLDRRLSKIKLKQMSESDFYDFSKNYNKSTKEEKSSGYASHYDDNENSLNIHYDDSYDSYFMSASYKNRYAENNLPGSRFPLLDEIYYEYLKNF